MDIVLVDDHPAVRAGLRGLLDDEVDLRVAATAATAREGFEAIADTQPAGRAAWTSTSPTTTACRCACAPARLPDAAAGDHLLGVRRRRPGRARRDRRCGGGAAQGHGAARCCSTRCRARCPRATLDNRALRAIGERLDEGDLPILGHARARGGRRGDRGARSGSSRTGSQARRWAMLAAGRASPPTRPVGGPRSPRRPRKPACDNTPHAHERSDPRGAEGRHRPRAAPQHRGARDGPYR